MSYIARNFGLLSAFLVLGLLSLVGGGVVFGQAGLPVEVVAYADMVLYNGKVLTADDKFTVAQAVAVRDGKILATGDTDYILQMAGPKTTKIDLKGGSVTPGFMDAHAGVSAGGHGPSGPTFMKNYTSLRGQSATLDEVLRGIKTAVDKAPAGEWVYVNPFRTAAAYQLNMQLLDQVAPNHPLLVTMDNTTGFVNSRAFAALKDYMADEVVQAGIYKDKDGKPTGRVAGGTYGVLTYDLLEWPSGQHLENMIQGAIKLQKFVNRMGITRVGGRSSGLPITIYREIQSRGLYLLRIRINHEFGRLNPRTEAFARRFGNLMDVGDEWFKIAGATVSSIDSNPSNAGVMTRQPIRNMEPWYAFGAYGQNKWKEMVVEGKDWKQYSDYDNAFVIGKYGWNVSDFHVQGDGGVQLALEVFDKINQINPVKGRRYGMVHGLMRPADLARRLAGYDAVLSQNADYLFRGASTTDYLEKQYGADAVAGMSPIKDLITSGLKPVMEVLNGATWRPSGGGRVSLGQARTDRGLELAKYLNDQNVFLESMELFVTRKNQATGKVWGPYQKISREEVLRMATSWASRYYGDEKILGTLEPGKLADMVVLGGDYMTVPEEKISDLPILKVILGGKVTYDKDRDEIWFQQNAPSRSEPAASM